MRVRLSKMHPNPRIPLGGMLLRVTSLEQLSLAEFSGEKTRPKVNENGHKKVIGL